MAWLHLFDASTRTPLRPLPDVHGMSMLTFSPDGTLVAAAGSSPFPVRVWRAADGELVRQLGTSEQYRPSDHVAFSPTAEWISGAYNLSSGISAFRLEDGFRNDYAVQAPELPLAGFEEAAFSPSGARLAAGKVFTPNDRSTGVTVVFRFADGTPEFLIPLTSSGLTFLDETTLARGELDGTVSFWCLE